MVTDDYSIPEILAHIDPLALSYDEWMDVGRACHDSGVSLSVWESWSQADTARFHPGECERKWREFSSAKSNKVTAGTIVELAMRQGWKPSAKQGGVLQWDDSIGPRAAIDPSWVMPEAIPAPREPWEPYREIIRYLDLLFVDKDHVGFCTATYETEAGRKPTKGTYHYTKKELKERLLKYKDDLGAAIGDYSQDTGAWIRFNPLDGQGIKDENVTDYRYALIESDNMDLEKQYAMIKELQLPVKVLVYSGGKSLHAIIHINAMDIDEYRKRVNETYKICEASGMQLDKQNRNPSRLSRLPGVCRNGKRQYIIAEDMGQPSWEAWKEHIDGLHDDLPEITCLSAVIDNLPPLAPDLIEGVLREGHKMLISGASKAGKSFLLIELCIAIANGTAWLGRKCKQGRVMYVNLELDTASCYHRFADVISVSGANRENVKNIDIWNLRGRSEPLDQLAPKLIRRAIKGGYAAVIVDPIYKVITGDENAADQMSKFCNQFDKIADQLKCAVIYCHHHSKGAQGGKRAVDRASGSGVFARDPDAILDLIEIPIPDAVRSIQIQKREKELVCGIMDLAYPGWREPLGKDIDNYVIVRERAAAMLPPDQNAELQQQLQAIEAEWESCTGWRLESTLREYPHVKPIMCLYKYPLHVLDEGNILKDLSAEGEKASASRARAAKKQPVDEKTEFLNAIDNANMGGPVTKEDLMNYLHVSKSTISNRMRNYGYVTDKNTHYVVRKEEIEKQQN